MLQRPLIFFSRPGEGELGQIQEVGALVGGLDVEKGGLPVLAGLDDLGTLIPWFAGRDEAASAIGHISRVGWFFTFGSSRHHCPRPSIVSSEVEEPFPESNTRAAAEVSFT